MTTKVAIISTVILIVAVTAIGCGGLYLTFDRRAPRAQSEARAAMLGSGLGVVTAIGCGIIWVLWLMKRRSEINAREEEELRLRRAKRRRARREMEEDEE